MLGGIGETGPCRRSLLLSPRVSRPPPLFPLLLDAQHSPENKEILWETGICIVIAVSPWLHCGEELQFPAHAAVWADFDRSVAGYLGALVAVGPRSSEVFNASLASLLGTNKNRFRNRWVIQP